MGLFLLEERFCQLMTYRPGGIQIIWRPTTWHSSLESIMISLSWSLRINQGQGQCCELPWVWGVRPEGEGSQSLSTQETQRTRQRRPQEVQACKISQAQGSFAAVIRSGPVCAAGSLGCRGRKSSSLFCSLLPFVIWGPWRPLRVGGGGVIWNLAIGLILRALPQVVWDTLIWTLALTLSNPTGTYSSRGLVQK